MQVRSLEEVTQHACSGGCHLFTKVKEEDFKKHKDDACPKCGGNRFEEINGQLVPVCPFIDFGVENIIKDGFFIDSEFCSYQGTGRRERGDYYLTLAALKSHNRAGALLRDLETSSYEIGVDWLEPYSKKAHSIGLLVLRCGMFSSECAAAVCHT